MKTSHKVAGIDVHKSMLAVVIADAAREGEWQFRRRKFGAAVSQLRQLAAWLGEGNVRGVVRESPAQYWKPVWHEVEGRGEIDLTEGGSQRAPRVRHGEFAHAQRV